jgi:uncharacterized protein with HEPN domain
MNRDRASLTQILERIELALEFAGDDKVRFKERRINQEAVIRELEVIGEAAKRVSATTRARSGEVPWTSMSGFKDVAMHPYDSIDLDAVWEIVRVELPRIRGRVRSLLRDLPATT